MHFSGTVSVLGRIVSRLVRLFYPIFQFLAEFSHELFENERVNIFAQLVQNEPISQSTSTTNRFDCVHGRQARPTFEKHFSKSGRHQDNESVNHLHSRDHCQNDEPKPEENVDFLVDDVQGEDAESVESLNSTRRTELVEGAFSHLGKHPGYGDAKKNILRIKKPFLSNLRLVTEALHILFKGL